MEENEHQTTESEEFTVSIEGPGLSVTRHADGPTAVSIVKLLFAGTNGNGMADLLVGDQTGDDSATRGGERPANEAPSQSIAEFLDEVNARNNFQRIAAIALYHQEHLGRQFVVQRDLPEWFARAGRSAPKNLSRDVRTAIKRRLIAERPDEEGQLFVTGTGKEELRSDED